MKRTLSSLQLEVAKSFYTDGKETEKEQKKNREILHAMRKHDSKANEKLKEFNPSDWEALFSLIIDRSGLKRIQDEAFY